MYNLDYNKLNEQVTPSFLRKDRLTGLLQSINFPVKQLFEIFKRFREAKIYELKHTGQVFSIENVLNDRFDPIERRIYITDGLTKDRTYIYTRDENKPVFLGNIFLYNRGDYADTGVDYIVWVPNAIVISLEEMYELRASVNKYKIDPKRFKVYRI